jgi:hypothetical protein
MCFATNNRAVNQRKSTIEAFWKQAGILVLWRQKTA